MVRDFVVIGEPVAQARARVTRNGTFTPKKSRDWKKNVITQVGYTVNLYKMGMYKKGVPLEAELTFYFRKPKSVKREYVTVIPDIDNLVKAILDACNGILYHDDSQIVSISANKEYCSAGLEPQVSFTLLELPTTGNGEPF